MAPSAMLFLVVADLRNIFAQELPKLTHSVSHSTVQGLGQRQAGHSAVLQHNQEASGCEMTIGCFFNLLLFTGSVFLTAKPLLLSAQIQCYRWWYCTPNESALERIVFLSMLLLSYLHILSNG